MKEEYAAVASALNQRIQDLNSQIAHMSGSLQVCLSSFEDFGYWRLKSIFIKPQEQKAMTQRISKQVVEMKQDIAAAAGLSNRCTEAKIDWGELEPIEDLEYEAQLLEDNIAAKTRFIENGRYLLRPVVSPYVWANRIPSTELVATNHSNVTKDKLLEWQATWQHFCDEELGYQVGLHL